MRLGLQKLTLLDFPGVMACTVFTCGCNFRCPFCHNASLVTGRDADMPFGADEVLTFLAGRKKMLDGVCITGGEPLLHPEMKDFIAGVKRLGYKVKLDTNGSNPARLREILAAGSVDYVAMDIKQSQEKYALASGSESALAPVRESVDLLKNGSVEFEFRTTVVAEFHDDDSFPPIGEMIRGARRYFLQCFTDRDTVMYAGLHAPSEEALRRYADLVRPFVGSVSLRGV